MTIDVALTHRTAYRYDRPIVLGPQTVRLRPAPHCRTKVKSYSLTIAPDGHFLNWQQDPFSNYLARAAFQNKADHFEITVDLTAEMAVINPFDFFLEPYAEQFPFTYDEELRKSLAPYLVLDESGPALQHYIASIDRRRRNTNDFLVELNQHLQRRIGYVIRMEPGVQNCETTLSRATGSCRDSGWVLVQILRHLGLAARFVSGYLIQLKPDMKPLDGPVGPGEDFTDLHAWAEVYLPGAGWIGMDPTSGLFCGEGHLPLCAVPHYRDAAPISGALEPCEVTFDFHMQIERIRETPRVTLPYTPGQWQAIDRLGHAVDQRLVAQDVRLTMGGEPTFVSVDDRDGEEWNTEAVGPSKRWFADRLIHRLRERFAPGGVLHHGQGKWYPGEPLPRWAFGLYWRRDGEALWANPELIAPEYPNARPGAEEAERFTRALAENLELDVEVAQPVYEDPGPAILTEQNLPANLDPRDSKLDDPEERARLARMFERGLGQPTGFVVPLQAWQAKASGQRRFRWRSERWQTRRGRLYLIPGNSPAGFRLPLGALSYIPPDDYPQVIPLDPFAARASLPGRAPIRQQPQDGTPPQAAPPASMPESIDADSSDGVRTALTVEPRDGHLRVFMPPINSFDEYFDILAAVEETATALAQPIHIEGYTPPPDPRINTIKVTPDPGVLEVNIHPSASWAEQTEITTALYDIARECRLDTAKFMLDGRPTGTGGGNHIVVGGATAADSPFLRRPDLLGSLIRYWQNHPSLSYLFSGAFIGPTSQAPRIDEARDDQLYEMELALNQVPHPDQTGPQDCPPWLVDRLFRNLLIDATGNTHRAEICIDKLFDPNSPTGRLGLVEFRAFEMPPHPRMSLVQALLLRALIAWFWQTPYTQPLVRHGTGLHDRFMLPAFVWADFKAVLDDLAQHAGLYFDPAWFAPHVEFRFPVSGTHTVEGIELQVRAALEPWHVLGEEGAIGGTVRYVDSSLERVELRARGAGLGSRYAVACHGIRLPLSPAPDGDGQVAGVRFRAWQPPLCLHPTIPVHAPLVFQVIDRLNSRAVGGCTYHVMHPGGRSYETSPVNDLEAEARRLGRFTRIGHTPGVFALREPGPHGDFPHTLDLRRFHDINARIS